LLFRTLRGVERDGQGSSHRTNNSSSCQARQPMHTQNTNAESDSTRGTPSPEAVVRRLIDVGFSLGCLEVAEELIAEDCLEHQDYGPNHPPGPEGVKAVIASLHRAFPDYHLSIEAICVQSDLVWT